VDLQNAVVSIPDSKTPNGVADVPLTPIEAFKNQMAISGTGPYLFPRDLNPTGHLKKLKTVWRKTLRRAKIPYFRIYDLRSAYDKAERGRRSRRVGNATAPPERCASLQEVFANEAQDEARSLGEAKPSSQRNGAGRGGPCFFDRAIVHGGGPMTHSCTVRAQFTNNGAVVTRRFR
jgi:hypothetical protein